MSMDLHGMVYGVPNVSQFESDHRWNQKNVWVERVCTRWRPPQQATVNRFNPLELMNYYPLSVLEACTRCYVYRRGKENSASSYGGKFL